MTERCLRYRESIAMLKDAGYVVFGRPRSRAPVVFTRLVVACNLIGEMIGVNPYRIYQSIVCRVEWLSRGRPHNAINSGFVRGKGHQDADSIHVWCPHCGQDLLAAGPVGPSEIAEGMAKTAAMRGQLPQKSPHSEDVEGENSHEIGKAVKGKGRSRGAGVRGVATLPGAHSPAFCPTPPHTNF